MQTFILVALLAIPALSISLGNHIPRNNLKHRSILDNTNANSLEKRGANGHNGVPATWYNVQTGNQVACGGFKHNSDWVRLFLREYEWVLI